jgi:fructose-specific PTS system IIB-like component
VLPVVEGKGGFIAGLRSAPSSAPPASSCLKPWRKRKRQTPKPMTRWILISKLTETLEGIFMTKIIAVTAARLASPTYMAAESLESAAKAKGWQVKVETQGSIGIENELTAEDVASADMVILTKDIGIKFEERFAGKTIVRVNISDAVKRAEAIMNKIDSHLSQNA